MNHILETEQSGIQSTVTHNSRYAVSTKAASQKSAYERKNNTVPNTKRINNNAKGPEAHWSGKARINSEPSQQDRYISLFIKNKKRLPSGFGSIRSLGKGRRKAYAVHPPAKMCPSEKYIRPPALCYVADRESGFKVLSLYHAGLYTPGIERNSVTLRVRFGEMLRELDYYLANHPGKLIDQERYRPGRFINTLEPLSVLSFLKIIQLRYSTSAIGSPVLPNEVSFEEQDENPYTSKPDENPHESHAGAQNNSKTELQYTVHREISYSHANERMLSAINNAGISTPGIIKERQNEYTPFEDPVRNDPEHDFYEKVLNDIPFCSGKYPKIKTEKPDSNNDDSMAIQDISLMHKYLRDTLLKHIISGTPSDTDVAILKKWIRSNSEQNEEQTNVVNQYSSVMNTPSLNPPQDVLYDDSSTRDYQLLNHRPATLSPQDMLPQNTPLYNILLQKSERPVVQEVYKAFYEFKYGSSAARQLSKSSRNASSAAFRKLEPFYDRSLDEISVIELQNLVNRIAKDGYSRSAVSDLVTLIRQLYRFAFPREMCTKEYGTYIVMPYTEEEMHHQDFTDSELQILWAHKPDPVVSMLLIMCYSGFRISEFAPENKMQTVIDIDGKKGYFRGGIKTNAGKNRIVPIHSAILPLVRQTVDNDGHPVYLCGKSTSRFRTEMKRVLEEIGIDTGSPNIINGKTRADATINTSSESPTAKPRYHTPHSCRHTFSRLCESYGVNEADRKRLLGHTFGTDITNGVYGHRSVEELSRELEKIKVPPV